jgi:ATP-binding cassette subfamily B protein
VADVSVTVMTAFSQWMGDILAVRLQTYLSRQFYEHVLSLHVGFFDNEVTGKIVNKMYRGIESITEFIQNMLNNFLPFFLTAFMTVLLLSRYSPLIALLLAVLFPIYILISHRSSEKWQVYENDKNTINDLSQGRVFESLVGIRVVKAFVGEIKELKSYTSSRNKIESLTRKQTKEWHMYDFVRRLCLNIILFCIYVYIVYWTFNRRFTLGEMTLLLQLVNQARFPLFAMSFILGQIQQASAGSNEFFKTLGVKNQITDDPDASVLKIDCPDVPTVEFKNVSFGYEKSREVLKNISFKVMPGERIALVGESGQGKSTIVNLLLRYYEPQRGEIKMCGQEINHVTLDSLHTHTAVVFQESLLFSGTIKENIVYANPEATKNEIEAATKAANADGFIKELARGEESLVGERGVKLSGGQKQRLAIARAILKNAPLVILDEATSSLDSRSEIEVQKGLEKLLQNRTSIIIAHRLSTISNADKILVLQKGTVAQFGKPQELLQNENGLYYQLVNLQQKLLTATAAERDAALRKFDLVA